MRVVSGALFDAVGCVLMGKRPMGKKRGGLWELPGGKIDAGEEPRAALAREWKEELDLDVTVHDFIAAAHLDLEVPLFIELYEVRVADIAPVKNHAHDNVLWLDPVDAMEYQPCSPAFYLHYPHLRRWFAGRRR